MKTIPSVPVLTLGAPGGPRSSEQIADGLELVAAAFRAGHFDVTARAFPEQAVCVSLPLTESEAVLNVAEEFGQNSEVTGEYIAVNVPFGDGSDPDPRNPSACRGAVVVQAYAPWLRRAA